MRRYPVHDLPEIALHVLHDHEQVLKLKVLVLFAVGILANYHVVELGGILIIFHLSKTNLSEYKN